MRLATQAIRFVVVGALGAATNFMVFFGLTEFAAAHYLVASWAGWIIGLILVFNLNRRFTFKAEGRVAAQFAKTIGVYIIQQVLFSALLALFIEAMHLDKRIAYFAALPFAIMVSFFGMRDFAFRKTNRPRE